MAVKLSSAAVSVKNLVNVLLGACLDSMDDMEAIGNSYTEPYDELVAAVGQKKARVIVSRIRSGFSSQLRQSEKQVLTEVVRQFKDSLK